MAAVLIVDDSLTVRTDLGDALEASADGVVRKDDLGVVRARVRALLRSSSSIRIDVGSLLTPKRILAVDDDPDFLGLLGDRLYKRGYDVARARARRSATRCRTICGPRCAPSACSRVASSKTPANSSARAASMTPGACSPRLRGCRI